MPIYEFKCPECGTRFEELCDTGVRSAECPACGYSDAPRVLSAPAPPNRLAVTPGQARKLEDKRGTDRGGARQRFAERRAAERRAGGKRG